MKAWKKPLETPSLLWGVGWGCAAKLSLFKGWRESVSPVSSHGFKKHPRFHKTPTQTAGKWSLPLLHHSWTEKDLPS